MLLLSSPSLTSLHLDLCNLFNMRKYWNEIIFKEPFIKNVLTFLIRRNLPVAAFLLLRVLTSSEGRMVNHLTRATAGAENQAGFFRHSSNVMLPMQHIPSTGSGGCSPRRVPGHCLLLGLQFRAALNLINLQPGGLQCVLRPCSARLTQDQTLWAISRSCSRCERCPRGCFVRGGHGWLVPGRSESPDRNILIPSCSKPVLGPSGSS